MSKKLVDIVKQNNARITPARKLILQKFEADCEPVRNVDLLEYLQKNKVKVNKTTVYREIEFLKSLDIIHEVYFDDGVIRYERKPEVCHHHLICSNCGQVQEVDLQEYKLIEELQSKNGFKVEKHSIEFWGVCKACQ